MSDLSVYLEAIRDLAVQVREAALDHAAFEQRLQPCELTYCRATCCHDGVRLSASEAAVLIATATEHAASLRALGWEGEMKDALVPDVRPGGACRTATRAARAEELAVDFPAHFPATRCVFLDAEHRCLWQKLAVSLERHPWHYKPLTCWLHPLVLVPGSQGARPLLTLFSPETDPQRAPGYAGFASCTPCGRQD
ncbi:MAG: hypothetical protein KDK99_19620, partial [Verrucomicrobiales bacterium]|nr:hypothetical protein [Verrucomicrobiales bacterium]